MDHLIAEVVAVHVEAVVGGSELVSGDGWVEGFGVDDGVCFVGVSKAGVPNIVVEAVVGETAEGVDLAEGVEVVGVKGGGEEVAVVVVVFGDAEESTGEVTVDDLAVDA